MYKYLLIALLCINIVYSLIIIPENPDLSVTINNKTYQSINISYTNTSLPKSTIYNITFSDLPYFEFETINNLSINETKELKYNILTNETFNNNYMSELSFYYLDYHQVSKSQYTIEILSTGFNNYEYEVYYNDTIIFKNTDSINHTILNIDDNQEHIIPINQTLSINIDSWENLSYIDMVTSSGLQVGIKNNTILMPTRNPNYNQDTTFKLKSTYPESQLNIILTKPYSPIDYNQKSTGVIQLRTNTTIHNLNLKSNDWITFSENDFNVESDKVITFSVVPQNITSSDQTNKTYDFSIDIEADNINKITKEFQIFINYYNFTHETEDDIKLVYTPLTIDEQKRFCEDNNWEHPTCQEFLQNVTKIEYVNRTIRPEISEETVYQNQESVNRIESDIGTLKSKTETNTNAIQTTKDELKQDISSLVDKIDPLIDDISYIKENTQKTTRNTNIKGILLWSGIVLSIIIILGISIYQVNKLKDKTRMTL